MVRHHLCSCSKLGMYVEERPEEMVCHPNPAIDVCLLIPSGGQLRPHLYSRYPDWSVRFGKEGALAVIQHEAAHLSAFKELFEHEGIAEEVCFKLGETFDAAMSEEAWVRLKGAYEMMKADHGDDGDVIRDCRLIEDPTEAEEFTQMKGCVGAVIHPSGQV
jgi:plasmid maintenance system antidote protein VapI